MKIAIFGASGRTGVELVTQGLEKGHEITAFVRDPDRLPVEDKKLTVITGDIYDPSSVEKAVRGQDAVICALGGGQDLKKTNVRAIGTINIISGMKKNNVDRLLVVTAMGVGESWDTLSFINKAFFSTVLKSARDDHEAQESAVKESGLAWTIIRPSGLQDGPRTGDYDYGEMILAKKSIINRADVADLILRELEENQLIGKAVTIST
jgi:putative NADH-flavin reductase